MKKTGYPNYDVGTLVTWYIQIGGVSELHAT